MADLDALNALAPWILCALIVAAALTLLLSRAPFRGFPRVIHDHWYCGAWVSFKYDLDPELDPEVSWPIEGKAVFNPWKVSSAEHIRTMGDDTRLVRGLIPALRIGDRVGLYEATRPHYSSGTGPFSDWAHWDNGLQVDLVLRGVVDVAECPWFKKEEDNDEATE